MPESEVVPHANTKPDTKDGQQRHEVVSTDPRAWQYDKDKTIEYQVRQLPSELTFTSLKWIETFPCKLKNPRVKKRNDGSEAADLTWEIDASASLNGAFFSFDEFGYDKDGYIWKLGSESPQHIDATLPKEITENIVKPIVSSIHTTPLKYSYTEWRKFMLDDKSASSWTGQRFGKEW